MNDPVADAVRGILDGHVVLDRRIAERGRYPAIDVLRSLSRTVPGCLGAAEGALARRARAVLALHAELADLVRLGAYKPGADPQADAALAAAPRIEAVLQQDRDERRDPAEQFRPSAGRAGGGRAMTGGALQQALRLRSAAVAAARRELAATIAVEREAAGVLAACTGAIGAEIAAASHPDTDDAAVEALGPWLREARAGAARAEAGLAAAEAATVRARAALAAACSAEAVVAALIDARAAAAAEHTARAEAAELAEAAQRRPAPPGRGKCGP